MKRQTGKLLLAAVVMLAAGCRVGVSVFEGGDVIALVGDEQYCFEGGTCEFTIDNVLYTQTFVAKPRAGYEFTKWRDGEGFLCANSTNPECSVSLAGRAAAQAIISTDIMAYLVPEFTCVGTCPNRPDPVWRPLGVALDAMEEAKDAVSAYVATNGEGASNPIDYGIGLRTRNSDLLRNLDILPWDATLAAGTDHQFYIVANVYDYIQGEPDSFNTIAFALSGQTNADHSMTWECIPNHPDDIYIPNGPDAIPEPYLPIDCRGM